MLTILHNWSRDKSLPPFFTGIAKYTSGTIEHFKLGRLHREDGPAIEWSNGDKEHWLNGVRIEPYNKAYFVDGKFLNYEEYDEAAVHIIEHFHNFHWFVNMELCWSYTLEEFFFKIYVQADSFLLEQPELFYYGIRTVVMDCSRFR